MDNIKVYHSAGWGSCLTEPEKFFTDDKAVTVLLEQKDGMCGVWEVTVLSIYRAVMSSKLSSVG